MLWAKHGWAERLHKESLRPIPAAKSRYGCSNCPHRLTRKQASKSKGMCTHCGERLKAHFLFSNEEPRP